VFLVRGAAVETARILKFQVFRWGRLPRLQARRAGGRLLRARPSTLCSFRPSTRCPRPPAQDKTRGEIKAEAGLKRGKKEVNSAPVSSSLSASRAGLR